MVIVRQERAQRHFLVHLERPRSLGSGQVSKIPDLAREIGVSAATIYTWKSKCGGMDVSDAQEAEGAGG